MGSCSPPSISSAHAPRLCALLPLVQTCNAPQDEEEKAKEKARDDKLHAKKKLAKAKDKAAKAKLDHDKKALEKKAKKAKHDAKKKADGDKKKAADDKKEADKKAAHDKKKADEKAAKKKKVPHGPSLYEEHSKSSLSVSVRNTGRALFQ